MAGLNLGGLGDLGDIGEQFLVWQVLGQIASAVLGPLLVEVQQDVAGRFSRVALSPADAATAVLKGYMDEKQGATEASLSGIEGDRFKFLVESQGEPPGLETLLEWARRGIIKWNGQGADDTSLEQGVRESRIKPKWTGPIEAAKYDVLSPGQAVAAGLRGNLPMDKASAKAAEAGVDPADFVTMVHNSGNPPSLGELLELFKRGLIPAGGVGPETLSVQQGVYEGDTKDKWYPTVLELGRYLPPPRTITAMLREGALTDAQAAELLGKQGLDPELAQAYLNAVHGGTKASAKELTQSQTLQLYADGLLSRADALAHLQKAGLPAADAGDLVALQDVRKDQKLQGQVLTRIRTLYLAHHITQQQAQEALRDSGLAQDEVTKLVSLWTVEATIPSERLSAAQIEAAVAYNVITPDQGIAGLVSLGWSQWEAWFAISVRLHGKATVPEVGQRPAWAS